MSFAKTQLKKARDAIGKKDYTLARDASAQVLEYEPENYNANVFLGLASLELGDYDKSEQAYQKAISLQSDQPLAWQGIIKFYEKTEKWEKCADSLQSLMKIYHKTSDATKCAETFQKLLDLRREHGTSLQVVDALSVVLPDSPFYSTLASLPPPDPTNPTGSSTTLTQTAIYNSLPTLEEIISILEMDERLSMQKEIDKRRMRLNAAGLDQIKREVGLDFWSKSRLPALYSEVINHPNTSDTQRRETEWKLLEYKQRHLHVIPNTKEWASRKTTLAQEVNELIQGVIILKIPYEAAWIAYLQGVDSSSIDFYDRAALESFVTLFPSSPLTTLLRGYCAYTGIPWFVEETADEDLDEEKPSVLPPFEEAYDEILAGYTDTQDTIIANRVMTDIYLLEEDYTNAIKTVERGLEVLRHEESNTGKALPRVHIGFKASCATALVHLFPPKHHPRAMSIIEEVLSKDPENVPCLMGHAYILQASKNWQEAAELFNKVDQLLSDDSQEGLRAREESAWCRSQLGHIEESIASLGGIRDILQQSEDRSFDLSRCLWRLGLCHWALGELNGEQAYKYYIASLKVNSTYAPAFTALGVYYSEHASPPDPVRASKCFQKAFELDSREADAARRLAQGFADEREWDLVEVVARRTIDGEGGLNAGLSDSTGTRFTPTNAWAWKAVGAVELNRKNYPAAIQAFQIALRAEPEDHLSWLRLGESYGKGGRHAAALKALKHAEEINPNDWMGAYITGEVYQSMALYPEAISAYRTILGQRPTDIAILSALSQCLLESGRNELAEGYFDRAEISLIESIHVSLKTIDETTGYRGTAWKTVADAMFILSKRSRLINEAKVYAALHEVLTHLATHRSDRLSEFLPLPITSAGEGSVSKPNLLETAIVAYDYRLALSGTDHLIKGSAWYDLGVSAHTWSQSNPLNPQGKFAVEKAIQFLKNAIREEPGNDIYWVALGDINFLTDARMAQQAYVKALDIDQKSVASWTRIGLLYLHYEDLDLANQAFYRAQVLDPEYALAWLGQALVATAHNHEHEVQTILQHASTLTAPVPAADLEFAARVFEATKIVGYGAQRPADHLLPAFFVISRYCERYPSNPTALHLLGLLCESLGQCDVAIESLQRAIAVLEATYEESEDPEIERQFTIANLNLARLRLSVGDHQSSLESYENALGLLGEDPDPEVQRLRIHAELGAGLAKFMLGDLEAALSGLESAVSLAGHEPELREQVVVMLAQVMWAIGTEEFKEAAQSRLLECITTNPENLTAINALAGMGILLHDEALVDAALSEIIALPPDRRQELDPQRDVDYLLIQHQLAQGKYKEAISVAQAAVLREPSRFEARNALVALALQRDRPEQALGVLANVSQIDATQKVRVYGQSLSLQSVALSRVGGQGKEASRKAQRLAMLRPADIQSWQTLAYARGSTGEITASG